MTPLDVQVDQRFNIATPDAIVSFANLVLLFFGGVWVSFPAYGALLSFSRVFFSGFLFVPWAERVLACGSDVTVIFLTYCL